MDPTTFAVIFCIGIAALVVFVVWRAKSRTKENSADGVIATLALPDGALRLTRTELIEGWGDTALRHPIANLNASVEDSGTVNRRLTVTRIAALGPLALALPKKLDDRELYLMVEGPDTVILRQVAVRKSPAIGKQAREFAMRLNQLSTAASKSAPESGSSPEHIQ